MTVTDRKLLERIWKAVAEIPRGSVASYGGIARRAGEWTQPEPRYTSGVFAKYANAVGSASEGAITR